MVPTLFVRHSQAMALQGFFGSDLTADISRKRMVWGVLRSKLTNSGQKETW